MSTLEFDFDEEPEEDSDASVKPSEVAEAVIYATDWTTETILSQLNQRNIDFSSRFQRRDAWTPVRKSRFIESLFLGLPVPQIVLAQNKDHRGRFIVLDGKQRLLTLLQFTGAPDWEEEAYPLRGLEIRDDLNGKTFAEMLALPCFQEDLNVFRNQTIRAVVIRNWPNVDFLYDVFVRLNTGSVQLSPQELRQALFPGDFTAFLDERSGASKPLQLLLRIDRPDFRMRDVEILLRFIAFARRLPDYSGNLRRFLDDTCFTFNSSWATEQEMIRVLADEFDSAIEAAVQVFEDNAGRRWNGTTYERRLNRAVLDALLFYFVDPSIRQAAESRANEVASAFQEICTKEDFGDSIEATTKSLGAVSTRLRMWGNVLREVLNLDFCVPELEGNRIRFQGLWEQE